MFEAHLRSWCGRRPVGAAGAALVALLGCDTRGRLTFPSTGDGVGPISTIQDPSQDTTVTSGLQFVVSGFTVDTDGVDTVYFETVGGLDDFQPVVAGTDSFAFDLPLTTQNLAGETILVRVFAVDLFGNHGDTASRRIAIQ